MWWKTAPLDQKLAGEVHCIIHLTRDHFIAALSPMLGGQNVHSGAPLTEHGHSSDYFNNSY